MSAQQLLELAPEFSARVLRDVSMAKHTSWHAGGAPISFSRRATSWILPRSCASCRPKCRCCGWGWAAIFWCATAACAARWWPRTAHWARSSVSSATRIRAEAGVPCARIARQCVKWGLGPAEFFAGIPGTLGGALAMNAGAWGEETWRHVVEVEVLDRKGVRHTRTPADYEIGYRHVKGPDDEWFIGARLEFERKPGINSDAIKQLLDKRRETQPIGEWSCGSVFVNPPGDHAARLIEAAGLKGFRIGDASVSREARQFHHQSRVGARRRHRGVDSAGAEDRRRASRHRAAHGSAHRRRTGHR